jgi:hypothetical protein
LLQGHEHAYIGQVAADLWPEMRMRLELAGGDYLCLAHTLPDGKVLGWHIVATRNVSPMPEHWDRFSAATARAFIGVFLKRYPNALLSERWARVLAAHEVVA